MEIKVTDTFKKEFKKLLKKDRFLVAEYELLIDKLHHQPDLGVSLGDGKYKIRLKNLSSNKGKSGGYRVITYTKIENTLVLVYIYSKNNMESVLIKKIDALIKAFKIP